MSVNLTSFSYVSCNVHRITLYTCQLNILVPNYCKNVLLGSFPIDIIGHYWKVLPIEGF